MKYGVLHFHIHPTHIFQRGIITLCVVHKTAIHCEIVQLGMVKRGMGQVHFDADDMIQCRIVEITMHHGNCIQCRIPQLCIGKCAIVKDGVGVGRNGIQRRLGEIRKIVRVLPQNRCLQTDLGQVGTTEIDPRHIGMVKLALE